MESPPLDFVLWKPSNSDQPGWASPWGRGRPGWHVECSAMIGKHLGTTIDIHGGGQDLIFPHHENEIAQGTCANGSRYCRTWVHNSFVTVDGQKMSKSQGNVLLVRNLLGEAPGEAIRLALLSTHYRNPLDWNESRLNQSRATLTRWYTSLARIEGETLPDWSEIEPDGDVLAALRDDLNVSRALKRLHELCYSLEQAALRHADLLVVGGTAITPNGSEQVDIASRDGRIVAIGSLQGQWSADSVLEAQGLHILPGVIDSQVHFREPGLTHKEDLEAGTRGAVLGGVTGVFEMPNTNPLTLWQADLQAKLTAAKGRAWCDYAFYIGGSGINAEQLQTLENLPGCAGVKVFMGSSFGDLLADDDTVLRRILRHGSRRMAVHAEDQARLKARKSIAEASGDICQHPKWRDVESAFLATQQIVTMAEDIGRRLHVLHVSTAEEMKYLARHKRRVTVEVTPHHLTMTAPECYQRLGSLAQMNPPVREQRHQEALWQAIREGVVDVIGSDHAPHTLEEKSKPYPQSPSGMTGVQTLLPVMLDHVHAGRLTLGRLVDLTSAGPARVFGIEGKGRIAVGYDADLTLVDLSAERTISNDWIASRSGWTPYDDKTVTGWPVHTVVRGKVMVRDETLIGAAEGRPIHFLETPDRRTNRA